MNYPHRVVISRPNPASPGGTLDQRGVWIPNPGYTPIIVYDGVADAQDPGTLLSRDQSGLPTAVISGDLICYLKDEAKITDIHDGDLASVTWEDGSTDSYKVVRRNRLEGMVRLRGLDAGD